MQIKHNPQKCLLQVFFTYFLLFSTPAHFYYADLMTLQNYVPHYHLPQNKDNHLLPVEQPPAKMPFLDYILELEEVHN